MQVLIVDDHPIFLKGIEYLLATSAGDYQTHTVADVVAGLAYVDTSPVDLLLLDLNLPGIDGAGMLDGLAERNRRLPTLTMSAEIDGTRILQALSKGALGFVPKSFEPQQMLTAIQEVCAGRLFLPAHVVPHVERAKRQRAQMSDGHSKRHQMAASYGITPRQLVVLEGLAQGLSNKEIASTLSLTEYTVKSHARALFSCLGAKNRTACVQRALSLGLLHAAQPAGSGDSMR